MWNTQPKTASSHASYTDAIFDPARLHVLADRMSDTLLKYSQHTPFDAVAGSGNSGVPLAACVSYKLGVPLIAVRKDNEPAAWSQGASGLVYGARYVIIDDLIASGGTIDRIFKSVEDGHENYKKMLELYRNYNADWVKRAADAEGAVPPQCVAIFLYHPGWTDKGDFKGIPILKVSDEL